MEEDGDREGGERKGNTPLEHDMHLKQSPEKENAYILV